MYSSNSTVSIHWLCTSQSVIILVDESVGYQDHIQQWGRTTISLPPSSSGRPLRDVRSRRLRRTHPCGPISNRDGSSSLSTTSTIVEGPGSMTRYGETSRFSTCRGRGCCNHPRPYCAWSYGSVAAATLGLSESGLLVDDETRSDDDG